MNMRRVMSVAALLLGMTLNVAQPVTAQVERRPPAQPVIFDTDIGDDIDDVLALGLILSSPELKLVGVTTAWGDTALRARLVDRLLADNGVHNVPVLQGIEKHHPGEANFSQAVWARHGPVANHADAVSFLLAQARLHPNELTLISVGPMTNLGAALDRDPEGFRKLKRVVMMGGSVRSGYNDFGYTGTHRVDAEYNIAMDPEAAAKVFQSGVPLFVMPLDSTQIKLGELQQQLLFTHGSPLTDALTLLYHQWSRATKQLTPTVFDAMAVAFTIEPDLCPTVPMHLDVDEKGYTREQSGTPNAQVCLHSDTDQFFRFYMPRLLEELPKTAP